MDLERLEFVEYCKKYMRPGQTWRYVKSPLMKIEVVSVLDHGFFYKYGKGHPEQYVSFNEFNLGYRLTPEDERIVETLEEFNSDLETLIKE